MAKKNESFSKPLGPPKDEDLYVDNLMNYFVESIDCVNYKKKYNELLKNLSPKSLKKFLRYLISLRIPKDDIHLEIFANMVLNLQETFPTAYATAEFFTIETIKSIFNSLSKSYFNTDKMEDLLNLGKFLGLLNLAKDEFISPEKINFKVFFKESIAYGQHVLRTVVNFTCQYLKTGAGSMNELHRIEKTKILSYLKFVYMLGDTENEIKREHLGVDIKAIPDISFSDMGIPIENSAKALKKEKEGSFSSSNSS